MARLLSAFILQFGLAVGAAPRIAAAHTLPTSGAGAPTSGVAETESLFVGETDGSDGSTQVEDEPEALDLSAGSEAPTAQDDASEVETPDARGAMDAVDATGPPDERAALDVPELIVAAAMRWGVSPERMLRVAWCESRWDPDARGAGGHQGLFQFAPRTWAWASASVGMEGASPFDARANAEAASWLMANAGPGQWGCR